jgi:hypothetical protein
MLMELVISGEMADVLTALLVWVWFLKP